MFKTMKPVKSKKWCCCTCSSESCSNSASGSQESGNAIVSHLAAIDLKHQSLLSLKESVNGLLSHLAKVDLLFELKQTVGF